MNALGGVVSRRPIAFDISMLEDYEPNRDFYLSEEIRAQLRSIGESGVELQAPAGTFARDILA